MKGVLKLFSSLFMVFLLLFLSFGGKQFKPAQARGLEVQSKGAEVELVYINSSGYIKVVDPSSSTPTTAIYTTSTSGWTKAITADVNGDGDAEVVAFKSSLIRIYDPIVPSGGTSADSQVVSSSYMTNLAAGDFDGDGRDEIAVLRNYEIDDNNGHIYVYDGNSTGTSWTQLYRTDYSIPWERISTGRFDSIAGEDIVVSRYEGDDDDDDDDDDEDDDDEDDDDLTGTDTNSLISTIRGYDGDSIEDLETSGQWEDLAAGNLNTDTNYEEIAASRNVDDTYNFYVFTYYLDDYAYDELDPHFKRVATGDVNSDSYDEVVALRNYDDGSDVVIYNTRSSTTSPIRSIDTGRTDWIGLAVGDTDGDGEAEVILARSAGYRIYSDPDSSSSYTDCSVSLQDDYWDIIAVGDIDGSSAGSNVVNIELGEVMTKPVTVRYSGYYSNISWEVVYPTVSYSPTLTRWLELVPASGSLSGSTPVTPTLVVTGDMNLLDPNSYPLTKTLPVTIAINYKTGSSFLYQETRPYKVNISWPTLALEPTSLTFAVPPTTTFTRTVRITQRNGTGRGIVWEGHALGGYPVSALDFPLPSWVSPSLPMGVQFTTPTTMVLTFSGNFTTANAPYVAGINIMAPYTVTDNPQKLVIRVSIGENVIYMPTIIRDSSSD